MHWLPKSVGRSREGKFKHAEFFLHDPVLAFGTKLEKIGTKFKHFYRSIGQKISVRAGGLPKICSLEHFLSNRIGVHIGP